VTEKYNPNRELPRFRNRGSASPESPNWEVLQAVVGFAFTIQQEIQKLRRDTSAMLSTLAQQQEASVQVGFPAALARITASALNLTEGTGAALGIGDERGMTCVAGCGTNAPPLGASFDARSGLGGECIRSRESVICMNSAADPRVDYNACVALGIRSMIYRPLLHKNKLIGVLAVFSSRPQHFSHRDITCLGWTDELVAEALNSVDTQLGVGALLREAGIADVPPAQVAPATPAKPVAENQSTTAKLLTSAPTTQEDTGAQEDAPPKPIPTFVGRIVDESVAAEEAELSFGQTKPEKYDSPIPVLVAAILVLSFVVVGGLVSYFRLAPKWKQSPQPVSTQQAAPSVSKPESTAPEPSTVSDVPPSSSEPKPEPEGEAQVMADFPPGMRFTSERAGAVLSLTYPRPVTYQGFEIKNPDRLYFDIHGLKLVGPKGAMISVRNDLVSRVRISLHPDNITRIVFDLRQAVDFHATPTTNPTGLRIELQPKSANTPASPPATPDANITIVIDPGHGGRDTGAVSANGLREKDLTLDLGRRLGTLLQQRLGAHVVYTRTDDEYVSLATRAAIANDAHADFLISIHGNSSSYRSVRGVETYYFQNPQEALVRASDASHSVTQEDGDVADARSFAADVHKALLHGLNDSTQTTRNRGLKTAQFIVLKDAHMPAVLAEVAFMSSRKDAQRLESAAYREKVAKALYQGIYNHVTRRDARILSATDLHSSATVASR
jgi:N-acetylmuramoyl-L-alanine amidase